MSGTSAGTADVVLSNAEACDLDLVLCGALPSGTLLGRPTRALDPAQSRRPQSAGPVAAVSVRVARPVAESPSAPARVVLRDVEHTPVAELVGVQTRAEEAGPVLVGALRPLRRRESGPLPDLRVDLTDPRHRDRAVLLLARPPVVQDDPELLAWAAAAGAQPLLLVPEGGDGPEHMPADTAWALAHDLAGRLHLDRPEVAVVPVHLREPATDEHLARAATDRTGSQRTLLLTRGGASDAAAVAAAAVSALLEGRPTGRLEGVDHLVEARLRRWRPRRHERGLVVFMTGLSGSGKSTLARDLDTHLRLRTTRSVTLLDGDVVRRLLSSGLGFDRASRELNVRRIGWVAARVAEHGGTAICSPIAPFAATRAAVRSDVERVADMVLVHVSTPLEECERRDLKGLYARARTGEIPDFTGISSPYEPPADADVRVDTTSLRRSDALAVVLEHLAGGGWTGGEGP